MTIPLVVKDIVSRWPAKVTLFLFVLNPLQLIIRRDAMGALARNTTILKLTHCNVRLMIFGPGIWSHQTYGESPDNSARISKMPWSKWISVLNSTTQTVC